MEIQKIIVMGMVAIFAIGCIGCIETPNEETKVAQPENIGIGDCTKNCSKTIISEGEDCFVIEGRIVAVEYNTHEQNYVMFEDGFVYPWNDCNNPFSFKLGAIHKIEFCNDGFWEPSGDFRHNIDRVTIIDGDDVIIMTRGSHSLNSYVR